MTINHVRNLLMNVSSSSRQIDLPGEEFVPEDFRQRLLNPVTSAVRRILFGADPDRLMLNYRLREYMTLLHTTELAEFVTDLDPRVTYWPPRNDSIFRDDMQNLVTQIAGAAGPSLFIQGSDVPNHSLGQLQKQFRVEIIGNNLLQIVRRTSPPETTTPIVTVTNGLSELVTLPGSPVKFRIQTGDNASDLSALLNVAWTAETRARPTQGLDSVLSRLTTGIGAPGLIELFGITQEEPYLTWRNLWNESQSLPYKLGAILLATAYRMNQLPSVPPTPVVIVPPAESSSSEELPSSSSSDAGEDLPGDENIEIFDANNQGGGVIWFWQAPADIVGDITFELWGAGAIGGTAPGFVGARGGGGGAYARKTLASVPSESYEGFVGDGTSDGVVNGITGNDTDTSVGVSPSGSDVCRAAGAIQDSGGELAASTGDVKYAGGDGADQGTFSFPGDGGGGGSSAGPNGPGNSATSGSQTGAAAVTGGGKGGDGGTSPSNAQAGGSPGGGGGGGRGQNGSPGNGSNGRIKITYYTAFA